MPKARSAKTGQKMAPSHRAETPSRSRDYKLRADKVERFCQVYRETWSGTKAALACGHTPKSAAASASEMLLRDDVQQELARLAMDAAREHRISAGAILEAISEIAYGDVTDTLRKVRMVNGRYVVALQDLMTLPKSVRRTISSVKLNETGAVELKFWSKTSALEMLARHAGLLNEVVKHEHSFDRETLDRMDDQTLLETTRAQAERYERHVAAMAKVRRAVGELPPASDTTKSPRSGSTPSPEGAKGMEK